MTEEPSLRQPVDLSAEGWKGFAEHQHVWSEETWRVAGSGYCCTDAGRNRLEPPADTVRNMLAASVAALAGEV